MLVTALDEFGNALAFRDTIPVIVGDVMNVLAARQQERRCRHRMDIALQKPTTVRVGMTDLTVA